MVQRSETFTLADINYLKGMLLFPTPLGIVNLNYVRESLIDTKKRVSNQEKDIESHSKLYYLKLDGVPNSAHTLVTKTVHGQNFSNLSLLMSSDEFYSNYGWRHSLRVRFYFIY